MRLFLALLVMVQHYVQWCWPKEFQRFVMPFEPGSVAVLVFFFLSGFVITEAADLIYRGRPGAFFTNRLLRIVPMFVAAVLVSFGALYVLNRVGPLSDETGKPINGPLLSLHNIVANLLTIFPLPGRFAVTPDFTVLRIVWALRVEMAFYLIVALLLFAGSSFRVLFNVVAAVLLALSAWYLVMRPEWNGLIAFAPYFCAGGALFFAPRGSRTDQIIFLLAAILSTLMTFIHPDSDDPYRSDIGATILFAVLTLACILLATRKSNHPRADRLFGDLSYPVYVGHWLPLLIFVSLGGTGAGAELATTLAGLALPVLYLVTIEPVTAKLRNIVRGGAIR
jgi:peptidoglycan/LPS O-acetylase OafA/YrhL